MPASAPVDRVTARLLPVSPAGEVLLLLDQDPNHPGILRWGTIGGAVDPGETLPEAAVRELREETGIEVSIDRLTAPFHRSQHEFTWSGTTYAADSTFFAMRLHRDVDVTFDNLEAAEVGNVFEARWFTPAGLRADGRAIVDDLPVILEAAVRAAGELS